MRYQWQSGNKNKAFVTSLILMLSLNIILKEFGFASASLIPIYIKKVDFNTKAIKSWQLYHHLFRTI